MRLPRRIAIAWLPVVAYMGLIWLLSSRPLGFSIAFMPFRDKGGHTLEYAMLAALAARAVYWTWPERGVWRAMLGAFLLTVGWGFSDELHQAFVPTRNADAADLAADAIGALIGVSAYAAFRRVRGQIAKPRA